MTLLKVNKGALPGRLKEGKEGSNLNGLLPKSIFLVRKESPPVIMLSAISVFREQSHDGSAATSSAFTVLHRD